MFEKLRDVAGAIAMGALFEAVGHSFVTRSPEGDDDIVLESLATDSATDLITIRPFLRRQIRLPHPGQPAEDGVYYIVPPASRLGFDALGSLDLVGPGRVDIAFQFVISQLHSPKVPGVKDFMSAFGSRPATKLWVFVVPIGTEFTPPAHATDILHENQISPYVLKLDAGDLRLSA